MMLTRLRRPFVLAASVWLVVGVSAAERRQAPTTPQTSADRIKTARAALAAGRIDEALSITDEILAASPQNRQAAALKIDALVTSPGGVPPALAAYDRYTQAAKRTDVGLLAPVALAELRALRSTGVAARVRLGALERLAARGDAAARRELETAATTGTALLAPEGLAADACLARLGDAKAQIRLGQRLGATTPGDKTPIVEAIKSSGAKKQAVYIIPLLGDANPVVKAAAAEALGALGAREALPELRAVTQERIPLAPLTAAVAVKQLGDPSADAMLVAALKSPVAEVRLLAASAFVGGKDKAWIETVRPMLQDSNGLVRVRAAELLVRDGGQFQAEGRAALVKTARDANPAVRGEAARILEQLPPVDSALLRALLSDATPDVRLYGAGGVLAAQPVAANPR